MKKIISILLTTGILYSCNHSKVNSDSEYAQQTSSSGAISLPFTASYSSQFNENLPDSELYIVLNAYKNWETGDIKDLSTAFADSVEFYATNGSHYLGPKAELMGKWDNMRDSMNSITIDVAAFLKSHSIDKNQDFINLWYTEIEKYKDGSVDSAKYEDINVVKNGKIVFESSYKQPLK